ncbi:MAG: immune inhibitor A, partial [Bacteroidales bacterium]|nr:immune inhibitor A [Bacteroidales bacterium]
MKKLLLLSLVLFFAGASLKTFASVDTYTFASSIGTYTEITGGTLSTASGDDGAENISLPFTFNYDGANYTTARISTNGWLEMGQTYTGNGYSNDLASTTYKPLLCPLWDDLYARGAPDNTEIRYETTGATPNQVFIVQWKNVCWRNSEATVNFQVKIEETTNQIYFCYGVNNSTDFRDASIGINDATGGSGHFISVTPGTPPTTSSTTSNNSINTGDYPGDDIIYTFTPSNAPGSPTNPYPIDGAIGVVLSEILTWDFGPNTVTYDLYFGTNNPPTTLVVNNQPASNPGSYDPPGSMAGFTSYYWKVVARNSAKAETPGPVWSFLTVCTNCCSHSIELIDTYGDGWGGGYLDVYVNNGLVAAGLTIGYGASQTEYFDANTGADIDVYYFPGNWSSENEYTVYDNGGTTLGASGQGGVTPGDLLNLVGNCPSCFPPTAQVETNISTTGANLGWTDAAGYWDLYIVPANDPAPTPGSTPHVNDTPTNPYPWSLGNSNITYDWYVRRDCGQDDINVSAWTGPSTFTTLPGSHSLPLYEDFESGFTYFGNAAGNNVDWAINTSLYNNGSQSTHNAYTSDDNNILHETGILDLTATTNPILQFAHIAKTEGFFDECYVEVSTDAGVTYTALPASDYQGSSTSYYGNFWEDSYTMWGTGFEIPDNTWWKVEKFDLSSYKTTNVRFRFRIESDASVEKEGWYVDDIYVGEAGSVATSWNGTGTKGTSWTDPNNWSNGVPGPNTNVTIPTGLVLNYPTILATAFCNNLTVKSDATGNGSLRDGGFLTVYGSVIAERYLTADVYHSYSPSVSGETAGIFHLPGSTDLDVYLYGHNEVNNADPYDGYFEIVDILTQLDPMHGYAVYADGANASPVITDWTFNQQGGLNTGGFGSADNVTRTGSGSFAGFNYIGNPYVSFIDWDATPAGWTKTNIDATIYVEAGGNWATYAFPGPGVNGGSNIVAPGQGFFIRVSTGFNTGTVMMDNNVRTHTSTPYLKNSVTNYVKLVATGNEKTDEMVIRFDENTTALFDSQYDGLKLAAGNINIPQIYSVSDYNLAYNALPETEWVQLGFTAGVNDEYTISATEINDIPSVWLEDTFTGELTNLQTESYTFTYSVGDDEARFIVHFTPLAVGENAEDIFGIYSYNKDVYVSVPENTKGDIVIYNMMGQEVTSAPINSALNKITLEESAYYVVKVLSDESLVT